MKMSRGFTLIETLLIIVAIAIIGLGGWWVWHSNQKKQPAATPAAAANQVKTSQNSPAPADPTAGWKSWSSVSGQLSLKYPASWVQPTNQNLCTGGLARDFEAGPSSSYVLVCASDNVSSQVSISSQQGDVRANEQLSTGYTNIQKSAVTINGAAGDYVTATAQGQQPPDSALGGMPDNTKVAKYIFFTNGNTYVAVYTQMPTWPDNLADFNLIVTKTLKFHS